MWQTIRWPLETCRVGGGVSSQIAPIRRGQRPVNGQPPVQSPALKKYVHDLREYVQAHGGILHDDTGDPAITLDMYEDGDHIARSARPVYTRVFYERLRVLFRPAPRVSGAPAAQ